MKLTDKCKQDFEKWFLNKYKHRADKPTNFLRPTFYEMDYPFQYGVLVDFFGEKNIELDIVKGHGYAYQLEIYLNNLCEYSENHIETRQEAREQAITKANEIYNE